jgi:hypothetical protein
MALRTLSRQVTRRDLQARVVLLVRSMCVVLAVLILSGSQASAGDYTVAYAFDADDLNDAGKIECTYAQTCSITSEKLQLTLDFWADRRVVDIYVHGNRGWTACCFFSDGNRSVRRAASESLIRLHVFQGRARKKNELIENALVGILYVQFSNMK